MSAPKKLEDQKATHLFTARFQVRVYDRIQAAAWTEGSTVKTWLQTQALKEVSRVERERPKKFRLQLKAVQERRKVRTEGLSEHTATRSRRK